MYNVWSYCISGSILVPAESGTKLNINEDPGFCEATDDLDEKGKEKQLFQPAVAIFSVVN